MVKKILALVTIITLIIGCEPEPTKFTINFNIKGAAGNYLKFINMTRPGLAPDSIQLDMGGKAIFERPVKEPQDYIFYFNENNHIRLTPCPDEIITLTGNIKNLVETHKIEGSAESKLVSQIIKQNYKSSIVLDTLNAFYMKNQLNPDLDSIINQIVHISDSIYNTNKKNYQDFIKNNPGSLASYITLSQKLGNRNFFTVNSDLTYFEMVDTALFSKYDTISMSKMLNMYLLRSKSQLKQQQLNKKESLLGQTAPEITLPNVYGDTLSLSSLRGKYVLVDFWGSWCRPCRKENPNLRNAYRKFRYKGFEIFQIAIERNKEDWKNTLREDRLYWKYQVSELNYMKSKVAREYKVKEIPSNFLLDGDGKIIATNLYGDKLLEKLHEIFNPQPVVTTQNQ